MVDDVIDRATAEAEFNRFVDLMDLDMTDAGTDPEEKADKEGARDKIVTSIMRGALVINDDGEPVFTPVRSGDVVPITFHEPTGASLMAMDRVKKNADIKKTYSVLAEITKQNPQLFSALKMGDLKVCLAVLTLFLG